MSRPFFHAQTLSKDFWALPVCDADCRSQRAMRDRTLFIEIMLVAIEQQLSQLATGGRGNLQLGAQRAERTSMVDVRKLNQLIHQ
ncbi:hypothetical protein VTP01DRAFT_8231 [Rhizomucor pusillus]|uniref:uncharacterized protein n=1 Tax=Rhizomucor pusillus TaxID=4840 RepID=UPI003743C969